MAVCSIGQFRGDAQLALAPDLHSGYPFVPSLDDFAVTDRKVEGLVRVDRAIELLARGEPSGVVDLHMAAVLGELRRYRP